MEQVAESDRLFEMSSNELRRREKAFDRLGLSTVSAVAICSVDLLMAHFPESVLGIVILALLFIAARTWFASSNARLAQTTWSICGTTLRRVDSRSRSEYPLQSVRRVQTKRTTSGTIREIKLELDGGASVYVNGLEEAESFRNTLRSSTGGIAEVELREPIDFDHPSFYITLGTALGAATTLLSRVVVSTPDLNGRWVYAVLTAYFLGLGTYWLRAKPISSRYGERAVMWDNATAITIVCLAVGAAIAAILG